MKKKIVVTSLVADPIHRGHIEVLKKSKEQGDFLIVLLDSNDKTVKKKGYCLMPIEDRKAIIESLDFVDWVIPINVSVAEVLELLKPDCFCKGGDRTLENLPLEEIQACMRNNIEIICGLGDKIQSSSELVKKCCETINILNGVQNGKE